MKKRFLTVLTIATLAITFTNCKDKAKEANASEAEPAAVSENMTQKYVADVSKSTIEWKGFKPTGTHNGTVNIDTGVFQVNDGLLESGTFLIDMTSIVSLDAEGKMKENLENHLKGTVEGKEGDFLMSINSTGAFEITSVESMEGGKTMLSGNLALKGMKHNISFPATVSYEDNSISVVSDSFTIDRTKWGVNYGSKSIFDNLGDKFINDEIELKINVVGFKKS